ncbi:NAD-dependent epimerase/dehydratase family protein [Nonomuraea sp. MG754425]|uniref:SDR family oxidoreductase n=1 Tax=Nonomuraea sp. MG754425 TaxID=2570319 RepID=UPI001F445BCC|nr:sugar nucleotide-binding protein [Nonomuraea sp. MG754425]MCF6473309.1 NAD-dependent epimerase/dehydratase family protein [Nonomuraea sp. MG754425]
MKVLIVGGSGFLGGELVRRCAAEGHEVGATYLTRPGDPARARWLRLDVRDRHDVTTVLDAFAPEVTINAAYRSSDWASTADGAAHVAAGVARTGGRMVQVSSDAIFSGAVARYDETCPPDPVSPYGAAKAAAETAVRAVLPGAAVARTSLIVGHGASAHEALVHSLVAGSRTGVLFTDDVRCPVHVSDLAQALVEAAVRGCSGVLHVAGADALSRYDLGVLIARRDGLDPARLRTGRRAGSGVPGPLEVRLNCSATRRRLATRLRGAREFLSPPA